MKLLVLHNNAPAQFKYLVKYAKTTFNCDILFLSLYSSSASAYYRHILLESGVDEAGFNASNLFDIPNVFLNKLLSLRNESYYPDVILSHSGWGCGLYSRYVFPRSRIVSYHEWWFRECYLEPHQSHLESTDSNSITQLYLRNSTISLELAESDLIITPTLFQKSYLPSSFQPKTYALHEGTDVEFYRYNPRFKSNDNYIYLTYATRGMEPIRGFDYFIKSIPILLTLHNRIKILIAGNDKVHYGGVGSVKGFKYGQWARSYLKAQDSIHRVSFLGSLNPKGYARLLKVSSIHFYYSKAFVPSWSLVDAMSSGCRIIATDIRPVREVLGYTSLYVDHTIVEDVVDRVKLVLAEDPIRYDQHCRAARERAIMLFNSKTNSLKLLRAILR